MYKASCHVHMYILLLLAHWETLLKTVCNGAPFKFYFGIGFNWLKHLKLLRVQLFILCIINVLVCANTHQFVEETACVQKPESLFIAKLLTVFSYCFLQNWKLLFGWELCCSLHSLKAFGTWNINTENLGNCTDYIHTTVNSCEKKKK